MTTVNKQRKTFPCTIRNQFILIWEFEVFHAPKKNKIKQSGDEKNNVSFFFLKKMVIIQYISHLHSDDNQLAIYSISSHKKFPIFFP